MEQTCPRCGTRNASSARFCKVDGTALSQEAQPQQPAARVCPACGTPNAPAAKFCKVDGVALGAASASAAPPRVHRAIWPAVRAIAIVVIAGGGLAWWLLGARTPVALDAARAPSAPRTEPQPQAMPPVAVATPGAAPDSTTAATPALAGPPADVPPVASRPEREGQIEPQVRLGAPRGARREPATPAGLSRQPPPDPQPRSRVEPPLEAPILPTPEQLESDINHALRSGQIDGVTAVVGEDGAVTLRGQTSSLAEKERAFRIARAVGGVSATKDLVWVVE